MLVFNRNVISRWFTNIFWNSALLKKQHCLPSKCVQNVLPNAKSTDKQAQNKVPILQEKHYAMKRNGTFTLLIYCCLFLAIKVELQLLYVKTVQAHARNTVHYKSLWVTQCLFHSYISESYKL